MFENSTNDIFETNATALFQGIGNFWKRDISVKAYGATQAQN